MPPLSVYLGLFTGTILAGLGVYLLLNPFATSTFSPTLLKTFSYFLIGYGGFRVGYSAYLLWRHRRGTNTRLPLWVGLLLSLGLPSCASGPEENVRVRFEYAGDCATCPLSRMDSLLRVYFPAGITSLSYDSTSYEVVLGMDSHHVRLDTLRAVLVAYGYQVDEDIAVDPILAPCCVLPETENIASGSEASLSLGSSADLQTEMSLLERELMDEGILGDESASVNINLDAELGLEDELGGLEDLDLEGGLDLGEDLGLDDLDLDMDLDLDDLGGSPTPKKKTPAKK